METFEAPKVILLATADNDPAAVSGIPAPNQTRA